MDKVELDYFNSLLNDVDELELIYECIPEEEREFMGDNKFEQCQTFLFQNTDIFSKKSDKDNEYEFDLTTDEGKLDYIAHSIIISVGELNIAFKGGYVLNKLVPNSRNTYDIDFSVHKEESLGVIEYVFNNIGKDLINKDIFKNYSLVKSTLEGKEILRGIKFESDLGLKKFGVDVSIHPLGYGVTDIKFDFGESKRFTVERSLSDKLNVICSRTRFRRIKDLYDIYIFLTTMNLNGELLQDCLLKREVDLDNYPSEEAQLIQMKRAYDSLELDRSNSSLIAYNKPEFYLVMSLVSSFVLGIREGIVERNWNKENLSWES